MLAALTDVDRVDEYVLSILGIPDLASTWQTTRGS